LGNRANRPDYYRHGMESRRERKPKVFGNLRPGALLRAVVIAKIRARGAGGTRLSTPAIGLGGPNRLGGRHARHAHEPVQVGGFRNGFGFAFTHLIADVEQLHLF